MMHFFRLNDKLDAGVDNGDTKYWKSGSQCSLVFGPVKNSSSGTLYELSTTKIMFEMYQNNQIMTTNYTLCLHAIVDCIVYRFLYCEQTIIDTILIIRICW